MGKTTLQLLLALLCGACGGAAWAQSGELDTDAYQGTWNVRLGDSKTADARVTIRGYEGTWLNRSKYAKANPCGGKKYPITVQMTTASSFQFTAWGSSLTPACPDISVSVKSVDASNLEGTVDADKAVRLSRK